MAPYRLPIFPLPLVLFPETPTALHIFEPRYRQMLEDCQHGDERFGIAFQMPEAGERPGPGAIGCRAKIRNVQPLPDGRSNIVVFGEERFVIRAYLDTDRLYEMATVEPYEDEPWDRPDLDILAAPLRAAFASFTSTVATLNEDLPSDVELPEDPVTLSFQVPAALELDPADKQALLELRSPAERLRRLGRLLDGLNEEAVRRLTLHRRAKKNGRGLLDSVGGGDRG